MAWDPTSNWRPVISIEASFCVYHVEVWSGVLVPEAYAAHVFKDTPLLSTIGVAELFHAATAVGGYHYRYLEPIL